MPPRPCVEGISFLLNVYIQDRNLPCALRFHAFMCNNGLEAHKGESTWLRGKAASICNSLPVTSKFPESSRISSLIKCGEIQHAFVLYNKMCEASVYPDEYVILVLIKACTEHKDTGRGSKLHEDISKQGWLKHNLLIGNALINMYAKAGLFEKALEVLDELPVRDVVSWNALIVGYTKHGQGEKALDCLEHMQAEGVYADAVTFVSCLKACGSIQAVYKGTEIHREIAQTGLLTKNLILGNALVDMYSSCSLLIQAQEVFDQLQFRDVVSWNTLMTGYIRHEQGEMVLVCLKQMQCVGLSPNGVTFVCCLKACGLINCRERGQELHTEISRIGLLKQNILVGNALVDMYAKCGSLLYSQEVFDHLTTRDVDSWNALISGYAMHDQCEAVLMALDLMVHDGVVPDLVTYVCSLKACGCARNAERGRDLHAEIERKRLLEKSLVLGSALLGMYAKCGFLSNARDVFHRLSDRDVIAWNVLISGYADQNHGEEALDCYREMQAQHISPNAVTFASCLKACGIVGSAQQGHKIHEEIVRKGVSELDLLVGSGLVDMYAKCGLLEKAQEVFDNLLVRDSMSWTALIMGYTDVESGEEALKGFEQMQLEGFIMDAVTLVCFLKVCAMMEAANIAKFMHARVVTTAFLERDPMVGCALVDMYAKLGLLQQAQEAFDGLLVKDTASWNALIAGYANHKLSKEVMCCLECMHVDRVTPDVTTLACILKVCGGMDALDKVGYILDEIARRWSVEEDFFAGNTLLDFYAKLGWLSRARDVFGKLSSRNNISWNALITGYANYDYIEEALECLEQMETEGVSPDNVTFVCALKACGGNGAIGQGRKVHAEIARTGMLDIDLVVSNSLVGLYAKCGWLTRAREVFDGLRVRDVISWNSLISGYAQLGNCLQVCALFDGLRREGEHPDTTTFISLLHACSQAVFVDKGMLYFEMMSQEYGISQTLKHHSCMVDLLGRAGDPDKALCMVKKMPFHPDTVVWLSMMAMSRKWRHKELGKEAFICVRPC